MLRILECERWWHAKKRICDLCRLSDSCIIVAQLLQALNSASGYGLYRLCIVKNTSMNNKKVKNLPKCHHSNGFTLFSPSPNQASFSCGCHMTSDVQSYWLALCSTQSIVHAWCPAWNFEFAAEVSSFDA